MECAMSDRVDITWTDAIGSYTSSFLIENPALADVRKAYTGMMFMPMGPEAKTETDEEFYARISLQMINQVMNQAQQNQMSQAMAAVPPVSITPVELTAKE
jgi:hypothetical protein